MRSDTTDLVVADRLAVGYDGSPTIEGVTFSLRRGEAIALLGPNGSGKTTLLRAIVGELRPLQGSLVVRARPAYLPQGSEPRTDIPLTALEVAAMGALARRGPLGRLRRADRAAALAALERVGLGSRAGDLFASLSAGQRQRVLIARALAQESELLLLDEPLAPVDPAAAGEIEELLLALRDEGRALLVATHDLDSARRFDRVLCINHRQVACDRPERALSPDVLAATYGRELLIVSADGGLRAVAAPHRHVHGEER